MQLKVRTIILLSAVAAAGLGVVQQANAGGAGETRLNQAQLLIDAKEYNQAILLLSALVDERPEYLDQAQALLGRVFEIREEYRDVTEQLVEALTVTKDPEVSLALIDRLLEIDPNPNDEVREQLAAARERVSVLFLSDELAGTMDRAAAELAVGDEAAAIAIYLSGYDVFRTEFDGARFGQLVVVAVDDAMDRLAAAASEGTALPARVREPAAAFVATLPAVDQQRLDEVTAVLRASADAAGRTVAASLTLAGLNDQLRAGGQLTANDSFLTGSRIITLGREGREAEGLAYAVERIWRGQLDSILQPLSSVAASALREGVATFGRRQFAAVDVAMTNATSLYPVALEVAALQGAEIALTRGNPNDWQLATIASNLPSILLLQSESRQTEAYELLAQAQLRSAATLASSATRSQVDAAIAGLLADVASVAAHASLWRDALASYRSLAASSLDTVALVDGAQAVLALLDDVVAGAGAAATALALPLLQEQAATVTLAVAALRTQLGDANIQLEGVPGASADVPVQRSPALAAEAFRTALAQADAIASSVADIDASWSEAAFRGERTAALSAVLDAVARAGTAASLLREDATALLTQAEELAFQASVSSVRGSG